MLMRMLLIAVLFVVFASNIFGRTKSISQEEFFSCVTKNLAWMHDAKAIRFEANQNLLCNDTSSGFINEEYSLKRKLKGVMASDGKFKIEIDNLSGASSGIAWTVAFDGKITYYMQNDGKKVLLYLQRGARSKDPILPRSNALLFPYEFLMPETYLPDDAGSYLTLQMLSNQTLWFKCLSDVQIISEPGKEIVLSGAVSSENGSGAKYEVKIDSVRFLPVSVTVKSGASFADVQNFNFHWEEKSISNLGMAFLPMKCVGESNYPSKGIKCQLKCEITSVEILSDVSESLWMVDLNEADQIFDLDKNIMMPRLRGKAKE